MERNTNLYNSVLSLLVDDRREFLENFDNLIITVVRGLQSMGSQKVSDII